MDCRFATIHPAPRASRRGPFSVQTGFAGYVKEHLVLHSLGAGGTCIRHYIMSPPNHPLRRATNFELFFPAKTLVPKAQVEFSPTPGV